MRAEAAVGGDYRPAIAERFHIVAARGDHRLNADGHAPAQPHTMSRRTEVRNAGILVHLAPDSMPAKVSHRGKAALLNILLNGMADIADAISFARHLKGGEKALLRHVNQALSLWADSTDAHREGAVGLPPIQDQARINRDNLALAQHRGFIRNAMHHLRIHRRADRGRIPLIVQEGRDGAVTANELFRITVKLLRGDTGLDLPFQLLKNLMQQGARLAHLGNLRSVLDGNHFVSPSALRIASKQSSIG